VLMICKLVGQQLLGLTAFELLTMRSAADRQAATLASACALACRGAGAACAQLRCWRLVGQTRLAGGNRSVVCSRTRPRGPLQM
jgi:hypothetical protein